MDSTPGRLKMVVLLALCLFMVPLLGWGTGWYMDARPGGSFRRSFTNFSSGHSHAFGGVYHELVPHSRLRYSDKFDDPNLPGEMEVTVLLKQVSCGTEVDIVQSGIPALIPTEMCYLGWQESLAQLACLVEPVIPG